MQRLKRLLLIMLQNIKLTLKSMAIYMLMRNILLTGSLLLFNLVCIGQTPQLISSKTAKSDIDHLMHTIESVHYNPYKINTKQSVNRSKDSILNSWNKDSITFKDFTKTGMLIASLMSTGHTSFDWQNPLLFPELSSATFLPFKVKMTDDALMVTSSIDELVKPGDTVISINDQKAVLLFSETMKLTGGIESFKKTVTEKFFPLFLFFILEDQKDFVIQLSSGKEIDISGINVNELFEFLQADMNKPNYTFEVIENDIGLISYNSCQDYEAFSQFLDTTFLNLKSKSIDKLIIDLRSNSGGDSSLNDKLLSYLTTDKYRQSSGRYWKVSKEVQSKIKNDSLWSGFLDESFLSQYTSSEDQSIIDAIDHSLTKNPKSRSFFKGVHCFLIGPYTFSSANYLADAIKTFKLSTLIGAATGELTNDFGEQVEFQLPNSKSYFFVPATFDIGADKNEENMSSVIPDIISEDDAMTTAIDFLKKKDGQK